MTKFRDYSVMYKPDTSSEKIHAKEPIDAAYKFFIKNPANRIVFVEQHILKCFEYHPSEFIEKFEDAKQIILDNCPEAIRAGRTEANHAGPFVGSGNVELRITTNQDGKRNYDNSNSKMDKGEKIFYLVVVVLFVLAVTGFVIYFNTKQ